MLLHGRAPGSLAAAAFIAAAASRMSRIADKVVRGAPMGPREDPGQAPVVAMMACFRAFKGDRSRPQVLCCRWLLVRDTQEASGCRTPGRSRPLGSGANDIPNNNGRWGAVRDVTCCQGDKGCCQYNERFIKGAPLCDLRPDRAAEQDYAHASCRQTVMLTTRRTIPNYR